MSLLLIYGSRESLRQGSEAETDIWITCSENEVKKRIMQEDVAMILIDLEVKGKKGMEMAEFIRQIPLYYMTPILFLAADRKMEWKAFHEIHCYDYILKPIEPLHVLQIILLCVKRMEEHEHNDRIVFSVGAERYPVNIHDILYLEHGGRCVTVHTTTVDMKVPSLTLRGFTTKYGDTFMRIHRGTVVNKERIKCVDFSTLRVELRGSDEELFIGKTYIGDVRKEFDEQGLK